MQTATNGSREGIGTMPEFIPEHTPSGLDDFTRGYVEAAEWLLSESDDNDRGVSDRDFAKGWAAEAIEQAKRECAEFQSANVAALAAYYEATGRGEESAGIDFFLTRNRHGAGFWDRGAGEAGDDLTDAAHRCGEQGTYAGDDNLIYFYPG